MLHFSAALSFQWKLRYSRNVLRSLSTVPLITGRSQPNLRGLLGMRAELEACSFSKISPAVADTQPKRYSDPLVKSP